MKKFTLPIVAFCLLALPSCKKVLFDSGALVIEDRLIDDDWDALVLEGSMDVYIVQDEDYEIRVEAGERKMDYIETRVFNEKLIISEKHNNIINDKQTKVYVSKSFINSIDLDGSGDIVGEGLVATNLNIDINGSGDIDLDVDVEEYLDLDINGSGDSKLTGQCGDLNLFVDGSGDLDAKYLPVQDCFIHVNGSGDSRVTVSGALNVEIDGSGDVYYWGQPETINIEIDGSGNVVEME